VSTGVLTSLAVAALVVGAGVVVAFFLGPRG
jgi:hypothetical protein